MARLKIDGEVNGVPETLRALRRIDPDLRREVPDRIKNAAEIREMVQTIRNLQPTSPPVSGWARWKTTRYGATTAIRWQPGNIRRQINVQFRGTRPRGAPAGSWPVLRIRSTHGAQSAFEMMGRKNKGRTASGKKLIEAVEKRYGDASRTIWPTVERYANRVERAIELSFREYAKTANRRLEPYKGRR